MRLSIILQVVVTVSLLGCNWTRAHSQQEGVPTANVAQHDANAKQNDDQVENIYVAHSIRVSTTSPPSAYCNNAPFKGGTITEANYTWSSVETGAADGRLLNSAVKTIG